MEKEIKPADIEIKDVVLIKEINADPGLKEDEDAKKKKRIDSGVYREA